MNKKIIIAIVVFVVLLLLFFMGSFKFIGDNLSKKDSILQEEEINDLTSDHLDEALSDLEEINFSLIS